MNQVTLGGISLRIRLSDGFTIKNSLSITPGTKIELEALSEAIRAFESAIKKDIPGEFLEDVKKSKKS